LNKEVTGSRFKSLLALDLLFLFFAGALSVLVVLPLTGRQVDYPYLVENVVFVLSFVLVVRYLFFLPQSLLAKLQPVKVGLVFVSIPFIFYLIDCFHGFRSFAEVEGIYYPMRELPAAKAQFLGNYMYREMVFFGTGAIVAAILFPFRLIISVWTLANRGRA